MNIIDTGLKFGALSARAKTTLGVVHNTADEGNTVEMLHELHKRNGWSGIGYHWYVRKDGNVYKGRPENMEGAHVKDHNSYTIGVALEGNYDLDGAAMPDAQKQAGIQLINELKAKYGIKFVGHRDLMATACPGRNFPFDEIVNGGQGVVVTPAPPVTQKPQPQGSSRIKRLQQQLNIQFKAGIAEDGILGPKTLAACIIVREGAKGEITRIIQEILIEKGIGIGNNDSIFGRNTKAGIMELQKRSNIAIDGIVGRNTWNALLK